MFTEVDIEQWPRRSTFEFFRDFQDPFFNLTANVDVTRLQRLARERGLSFSLSILYHALVVANEIREFRFRLVDGRVVEFGRIHATQTVLNDDETFSFSYLEFTGDLAEFNRAGKAATERYKQLKTFDVETERLDLLYCSVIPWVSFTSFKHASRLDRTQTAPRIVFGKMFEQVDRIMMPISVEANHAMMDGLHVGRFFNGLEKEIAAL